MGTNYNEMALKSYGVLLLPLAFMTIFCHLGVKFKQVKNKIIALIINFLFIFGYILTFYNTVSTFLRKWGYYTVSDIFEL